MRVLRVTAPYLGELAGGYNDWTPLLNRGLPVPGGDGLFRCLEVQQFLSDLSRDMSADEPSVVSGAVLAYRLFDIAYAIDLAKAEAVWAERSHAGSTRARLSATPSKAVSFGVPPVELVLEPVPLSLGLLTLNAEVTARLYDFGALTLALRLPVRGVAWDDFVQLVNTIDERLSIEANAAIWSDLLQRIQSAFAGALVRPAVSTIEEDYLIAMVETFSLPLSAEELLRRIDLVPLLSGEQRPLSPGTRQDLLRQRFSWYVDDLVVLTWDRAFFYEPHGNSDVVDVLEVANAQLLEMRYYDELLDAELPRMYDLIEQTQRTVPLLASRRYATLARRLTALVAEVTELTEKVDNALRVTEDVYLARVYAAALELFRVPTVGAAVDRKLAIIRDSYTALYEEASDARAAFLEVVVVAFIAVEFVLALLR